jgi:electron transfer flavoprotein alpha/beta subunit
VLAAAIGKVDGAQLVLTATESSDGYTGTVPEQIAAILGMPSITFAKSIEVRDGTVYVKRQTDAGYDEVECPLPCVVSVTAGGVEPRYPSFKGIMAAKSKPVDEVKIADLGIDAGAVGWAGGGQEIDPKIGTPGSVRALDALTGARKWDFPLQIGSPATGVLATAGMTPPRTRGRGWRLSVPITGCEVAG